MDSGLSCAEWQALYARACKRNDPAAWKELKARTTRAFLQFLDKQVGALIAAPHKKRLAEHGVAVLRRRARFNSTLSGALRDARGVLARLVVRALAQTRLQGARYREPRLSEFVGESAQALRVREEIAAAAASDLNVLIVGETGTGKELVAQTIHELSPRRGKVLICYNCGGTSTDLVASELFGHLRGAFTGATQNRTGLLADAHESHLLLDELEAMPLDHQVKLLRVVEDGKLRPVGGRETDTRLVSVRYLAATNRDPACLLEEGKLREDLYYRLRGREIFLPPLRERVEDILLLARRFLAGDEGSLSLEAASALQAYHWPGNVRQLENVLRNAREMTSFRGAREIAGEDIARLLAPQVRGADGCAEAPAQPAGPSPSPAPPGLPGGGREARVRTLVEVEREAIEHALRAAGGKLGLAAGMLGIDRSTLWRKLQNGKAPGALNGGRCSSLGWLLLPAAMFIGSTLVPLT